LTAAYVLGITANVQVPDTKEFRINYTQFDVYRDGKKIQTYRLLRYNI